MGATRDLQTGPRESLCRIQTSEGAHTSTTDKMFKVRQRGSCYGAFKKKYHLLMISIFITSDDKKYK